MRGEGDDLRELREHQPGDPFRKIAWKASARRGRAFSEAEHVLKKLAEETGGQWFFPNEIQELDSVYERIANELKSQYNVGYISNNPKRDGSWRRVVVQTAIPDLIVRTKLGYYAPRSN